MMLRLRNLLRRGLHSAGLLNKALSAGLQGRARKISKPFKVEPNDLGVLRPGVSLDNIGELLEQLEGTSHR